MTLFSLYYTCVYFNCFTSILRTIWIHYCKNLYHNRIKQLFLGLWFGFESVSKTCWAMLRYILYIRPWNHESCTYLKLTLIKAQFSPQCNYIYCVSLNAPYHRLPLAFAYRMPARFISRSRGFQKLELQCFFLFSIENNRPIKNSYKMLQAVHTFIKKSGLSWLLEKEI